MWWKIKKKSVSLPSLQAAPPLLILVVTSKDVRDLAYWFLDKIDNFLLVLLGNSILNLCENTDIWANELQITVPTSFLEEESSSFEGEGKKEVKEKSLGILWPSSAAGSLNTFSN